MAAMLGGTTDPKELIPGDAEKLGELATALTNWSDKLNGIGDGLGGLRIPGWDGKASDAFWPTLAKEKTNWYFAADAMSGAATAVTSYSSMLSWAQQQAATAIEQWNGGQHDSAETVLKTARQQLQHEADALAKKLDDLAGGASGSPGWLVEAREWVDAKQWTDKHGVGKTNVTSWKWDKEKSLGGEDGPWLRKKKEWGKDADGNWYIRDKAEPSEGGETGRSGSKVETTIKLAEWTGGANVWSAGVAGETTAGGATLKGGLGVSALGVDGSATASIADWQLRAGASGSAYLAQATANGSVTYGLAAAQAEGKAFAGADASVKVSAGKDGLHAGRRRSPGPRPQGRSPLTLPASAPASAAKPGRGRGLRQRRRGHEGWQVHDRRRHRSRSRSRRQSRF